MIVLSVRLASVFDWRVIDYIYSTFELHIWVDVTSRKDCCPHSLCFVNKILKCVLGASTTFLKLS